MPFFKNYCKDSKDLLTGNYSVGGAWKVESKFKGPDGVLYVNPSASAAGISADLEFNFAPFKTKTTVTDKGAITPKVIFDDGANKVEASITQDLKYSVVYEGKFGPIMVQDTVAAGVADFYLSYSLGPISVGGGAAYNFEKSSLKSWSAGAFFADGGIFAAVTTDALASYNAGAVFPVDLGGQKVSLAANATFGSALAWQVGAEAGCFLCPAGKFRVKVDQALKLHFAWFAKLSDNWKFAFGAEPLDKKFGFTFTRE